LKARPRDHSSISRFLKFFIFIFRESYLKKHEISHQQSSENVSSDDNESIFNKPISDVTSEIHSNASRRIGIATFDVARERHRFHPFSEFHFRQQRSAFHYVCHQNFR
jgi:hypothetical protein